jgi:hypothetical protein
LTASIPKASAPVSVHIRGRLCLFIVLLIRACYFYGLRHTFWIVPHCSLPYPLGCPICFVFLKKKMHLLFLLHLTSFWILEEERNCCWTPKWDSYHPMPFQTRSRPARWQSICSYTRPFMSFSAYPCVHIFMASGTHFGSCRNTPSVPKKKLVTDAMMCLFSYCTANKPPGCCK